MLIYSFNNTNGGFSCILNYDNLKVLPLLYIRIFKRWYELIVRTMPTYSYLPDICAHLMTHSILNSKYSDYLNMSAKVIS